MTKYNVITEIKRLKETKLEWLSGNNKSTSYDWVKEDKLVETFTSYTSAVIYKLELENLLPNETFKIEVSN